MRRGGLSRRVLVVGLLGGACLIPRVGSNVLDFSFEELEVLEKAWIMDVRKAAKIWRSKASRTSLAPAESTPLRVIVGDIKSDLLALVDPRRTSSPEEQGKKRTTTASRGSSTHQVEARSSSPSDTDLFWFCVGWVALLVCYLLTLAIHCSVKSGQSTSMDEEDDWEKNRKVLVGKRPGKRPRNGHHHYKGKISREDVPHVEIEDGPPVVGDDVDEVESREKEQPPSTAASSTPPSDGGMIEYAYTLGVSGLVSTVGYWVWGDGGATESKEGTAGKGEEGAVPPVDGNDHVDVDPQDRECDGQGSQQQQATQQTNTQQPSAYVKRVRFSAWQTEDDGEGCITREPFAAYELDGYDESSSDGSYTSGSDSEEESGSDEEGEGEEEQHAGPHLQQSQ